jgi:hypothetical protein
MQVADDGNFNNGVRLLAHRQCNIINDATAMPTKVMKKPLACKFLPSIIPHRHNNNKLCRENKPPAQLMVIDE